MEKRQKRSQIIAIIFLVILLIGAAITWWILWQGKKEGTVAHIYQNGKEIKVIHLDMVTEKEQLTIYGENGKYNQIQIENGKISIIDASCPDKICIETGAIQNDLVPIVCLPNKLMIKIEGAENNGLDAVAQ